MRHGWKRLPVAGTSHHLPDVSSEDPDVYQQRLDDLEEAAAALDAIWEREQRLTAHDFTGALPVAIPDGSGFNDSRACGLTSRAPREHPSKEAA